METIGKKFFTSKNIAYLGILSAIVIVLQVLGTLIINLGGTAFNIVLIPITLGALMLGARGGAILGLLFGMVTAICGMIGFDSFTGMLFNAQPVATIIICLAKGAACGAVPGFVYSLFKAEKKKVGTFVASALAPITNTSLFILGMFLFRGTFETLFTSGDDFNYVYFIFVVIVGINFLIEFSINMIASGAIYTVMRAIKKDNT